MSKTNPRLTKRKRRDECLAIIRRRVLAGEPCALCGQPIDLTRPQFVTRADGRRVRAPWSLECDEVVPVSRGGDPFDPSNQQPAHRACNIRKGNGRAARATGRAVGAVSRGW